MVLLSFSVMLPHKLKPPCLPVEEASHFIVSGSFAAAVDSSEELPAWVRTLRLPDRGLRVEGGGELFNDAYAEFSPNLNEPDSTPSPLA